MLKYTYPSRWWTNIQVIESAMNDIAVQTVRSRERAAALARAEQENHERPRREEARRLAQLKHEQNLVDARTRITDKLSLFPAHVAARQWRGGHAVSVQVGEKSVKRFLFTASEPVMEDRVIWTFWPGMAVSHLGELFDSVLFEPGPYRLISIEGITDLQQLTDVESALDELVAMHITQG